jgi:DNA-binding NtrC family response regulator
MWGYCAQINILTLFPIPCPPQVLHLPADKLYNRPVSQRPPERLAIGFVDRESTQSTHMYNGSQTSPHPHSPNFPTPAITGAEDAAPSGCPPFVGLSSALRRLVLQAEITASRLQFATIEGEAGTGKHLFAQLVHQQSALHNLPFRRRDAREWLATEADSTLPSGTLYLDRTDLLASAGQGLLLNLIKMLQSSPTEDATRNRRFLLLVSAHTSLRQLASQGLFLPDLAFRLTAVRFPLPPLREHREDIAPIAQTLIDRICRRYQQPTAVLAQGTLPRLLQHTWPGNVRELASVLESAILDSTTGILRPADFNLDLVQHPHPRQVTQPQSPAPAHLNLSPIQLPLIQDDLNLDAVIHRHIQLVLELNRGNKLRAARQLGISRSTLYRILAGETTLTA